MPGEVMMSRATAAQFDPALLGAESGGVVRLTGNPEAARIMPPFFDPSGVDLAQLLPSAYTRELRGEPSDPEHRHVAVAFVEIRGTDELLEREGPEALALALDERITAIQESCVSFDVTFAQTDVSKQAVKAILLAGAPRSAGGDEEELMLRAARAIVERPGTLPVRVGVNVGKSVRRDRRPSDEAHVHVLRGRDQHGCADHGARRRWAPPRPGGRARARSHDLRA